MASINLRLRDNWQTKSGKLAKNTEYNITDILEAMLPSDKYIVDSQIKDFNDMYSKVNLPKYITDNMYNPSIDEVKKHTRSSWGWVPDNSIQNKKTGKKIFIEVKRQDGWVEGKKPSAGRGNAHERGMKHFTPGIMNAEKEMSKITDGFLPFILIFVGDITRDPKRNREIYFWFTDHEDNYFMWRNKPNQDTLDPDDLYKYLYEKVLPHLE